MCLPRHSSRFGSGSRAHRNAWCAEIRSLPLQPPRRNSMWRSIKRWRDWAMHELATGKRSDSGVAGLHYGYEKAGLSIRDQPIPWNAETAFVEVEIPISTSGPRRKSDFQLYIPRQDIIV